MGLKSRALRIYFKIFNLFIEDALEIPEVTSVHDNEQDVFLLFEQERKQEAVTSKSSSILDLELSLFPEELHKGQDPATSSGHL